MARRPVWTGLGYRIQTSGAKAQAAKDVKIVAIAPADW
jgi:hypothetical protein